jgi:hypothetical protein
VLQAAWSWGQSCSVLAGMAPTVTQRGPLGIFLVPGLPPPVSLSTSLTPAAFASSLVANDSGADAMGRVPSRISHRKRPAWMVQRRTRMEYGGRSLGMAEKRRALLPVPRSGCVEGPGALTLVLSSVLVVRPCDQPEATWHGTHHLIILDKIRRARLTDRGCRPRARPVQLQQEVRL